MNKIAMIPINSVFNDEFSHPLYEILVADRDFDQAAPRDELTRTQDLSRVGWCKTHRGMFEPKGHCDRERLVSVGICADCDTALDFWRDGRKENVARIAGQQFTYGNHLTDARITQEDTINDMVAKFKSHNPARPGLGMGGDVCVIRFSDGRVVITNDLWHQGDVPKLVKHLLPDNAEFMEATNGSK